MAPFPSSRGSRTKLVLFSFLVALLCIKFLQNLPIAPTNDQIDAPFSASHSPEWLNAIFERIGSNETKRIKVGLVHTDSAVDRALDGLVDTVRIGFDPVQDLHWETLFPEWIDEDGKWNKPKCPSVPIPREDEFGDVDVVVAKLPCTNHSAHGVRDARRLQVSLAAANVAAASGRSVYVVFIGPCPPMSEIFRCDDLVSQRREKFWLYKPQLESLKLKIVMPVGSCQIAHHDMRIASRDSKVAYATVLHSTDAYVCGAIALAQSIRMTNSTKDLFLLHDSSIRGASLRALRNAGWRTRRITRIRSPFAKRSSYNEWNYSKLKIWQLTDYQRVIFIDSDVLVLRNMDEFFLYPQLSASPNSQHLFNSGVMVIEPSECVFESMMEKRFEVASYNEGDQGFLNEVFTWWHRLPKRVNRLKVFRNSKIGDRMIGGDMYSIHFLGLKPWMCYRDYDCNWDAPGNRAYASDSAHRRFWDVYDRMPERLQKHCGLTKRMDNRIRKWRLIARNACSSDGHWNISIQDIRRHHLV